MSEYGHEENEHTGRSRRILATVRLQPRFTRIRAEGGAQGVTVAEWVLLREMLDAGSVNPSQLADAVGLTRGAVSKLVERLSRKKLAVRSSPEGDQRYQTVELTAAGKRLVPVLAQLADENDREFFGHLKSVERTKLVHLLQDIVRRHGWKDLPVD